MITKTKIIGLTSKGKTGSPYPASDGSFLDVKSFTVGHNKMRVWPIEEVKKGVDYACSNCFAILDEEDEFCWRCGAELDTENIAFSSEDLKK